MKEKSDLARGWLKKAASDFVSMEATLKAGSFDGACFHAQQTVEKYLKAFLIFHDKSFPYTHNLAELMELCGGVDSTFRSMTHRVSELTPYAVRLRYDDDFWPSPQVAEEACMTARTLRDFILHRLPLDDKPKNS